MDLLDVACARSIVAVLALVAGVAGAQDAPVTGRLNQNLPKWLRLNGEYRARFEGLTGIAFQPGRRDAFLLNRVRLGMDVRPAGWLSFRFQAQDSEVFGRNIKPDGPPLEDSLDLRQAYVEISPVRDDRFSLRVGRQDFLYGEERLIGPSHWSNTSRSFDAALLRVRANGCRLDAFAASVVVARDGEFNRFRDGDNLHGLYGGLDKLVPHATIEPYLLWRVGGPGLDHKTAGFRWVGKLPAGFDYGVEMALQRGVSGSEAQQAWAGHWVAGYTIPRARFTPRLLAEYNYATGDGDPGDGVRRTFDQLYPTNHSKYGIADQMGWRNMHNARAGLELYPHAGWRLAVNYHSLWLATTRDGLYNASGSMIVRPLPGGRGGPHVGHEMDIEAVWSLSKVTQMGAGYARLFPGGFLRAATPGQAHQFSYLYFSQVF